MLGYYYFNHHPSLLLLGSGLFLSVWIFIWFFLSVQIFLLSYWSYLSAGIFSLLYRLYLVRIFSLFYQLFCRGFILLLLVVSFYQEMYSKRYFFTTGWVSFSTTFFRHLTWFVYQEFISKRYLFAATLIDLLIRQFSSDLPLLSFMCWMCYFGLPVQLIPID